MSSTYPYTTNSWVFQEFLMLIGKLVHSNLVRQIEFIKVENQILRSKLNQRVYITPSEKRRLIKYGLPLNGGIRDLISIVSYSTFRRWVRDNGTPTKEAPKRGRPRTNEEIRELVIKMAKENKWG